MAQRPVRADGADEDSDESLPDLGGCSDEGPTDYETTDHEGPGGPPSDSESSETEDEDVKPWNDLMPENTFYQDQNLRVKHMTKGVKRHLMDNIYEIRDSFREQQKLRETQKARREKAEKQQCPKKKPRWQPSRHRTANRILEVLSLIHI